MNRLKKIKKFLHKSYSQYVYKVKSAAYETWLNVAEIITVMNSIKHSIKKWRSTKNNFCSEM